MSSTQQPKSDSDRSIALDTRANALVHIGTDTRGHNHYYDEDRDRILVVDAAHDEYSREDSVAIRRSLVVAPDDIVRIITDGNTDDLEQYLWYVHKEVDGRQWATIEVSIVGGDLPPETADLLCELRAGAVALGRAPTPADMDEFGPHSAATVKATVGDWATALDAAGIDPETGELVDDLEDVLDRVRGDA